MKYILILIFFLTSKVLFGQVNIYIWSNYYNYFSPPNQSLSDPLPYAVKSVYDNACGSSVITFGTNSADFTNYDVVVVNGWTSFTPAFVDDLVTYIQGGGHVFLSLEGSVVNPGGGRVMSTVWNELTGQSIVQTAPSQSGTWSPPRFHNSNGPWNTSPDLSLTHTTGTYASFGNISSEYVTHQRFSEFPTCNNVTAISAVYPSRPNLGDGTLYIQGEIIYPHRVTSSNQLRAHFEAIAKMHCTLINQDQVTLDKLNTWEAKVLVEENFLSINDTVMCPDDFSPFVITSPTYTSYSWEDYAGVVLSTNQSYTVLDSGSYILKAMGGSSGCDGIDTIHVNFSQSPTASFHTNTVCLGESTVFTNTTSPLSNVTATSWEFGDGTTSAMINPLHEYMTAGTFNVELESTSLGMLSCSHDTVISVTVREKPVANFTVSDGCMDLPAEFDNNSTVVGGALISYEWDFNDGSPLNNNESPNHLYNTDGIYHVSLITTSNFGCTDTITKPTVRHAVPIASFMASSECLYDSVSFQNMSNVNLPSTVDSWEWSFGDGSPLLLAESPKYLYANDGVKEVTLVVMSNYGCVNDTTISMEIFPLPIVSFIADTVCENGSATTFFNSSTIPLGTLTNYQWNFGDNSFISSQENPVHNYLTSGTYNVMLQVESSFGCVDSTTQAVLVHNKPLSDFTVNDDCQIVSAEFINNSSIIGGALISYEWDFNDGSPLNTNESPSHPYSIDGTYQVSLITTSNFGCKDTIIKPTVRYAVPMANFTVTPECLYDSISFQDVSYINSPSILTNWIWDFGDGSVLSVSEEPKHLYSLEGEYDITLITSSNHGCVDDTTLSVAVYPIPMALFSNTTICENRPPTLFFDQSTVSTGSLIGWDWNFGDNDSSFLPNPSHSYVEDGVYNVVMIVETDKGCVDTMVNNVTVLAKPIANFIADKTEGCSPVCVDFQSLSISNGLSIDSWRWVLEGNVVSEEENMSYCFYNVSNVEDKEYDAKLIVTNDLGCRDTLDVLNYITSWHNPIADFDASPEEINMYEAEILTTNNSIGSDTYYWNLTNAEPSTDFEPIVVYQDTGVYEIMLISITKNQCVDTAYQEVKVTPVISIYVPSAFTPNGDGHNDTFIFKGFGIDESSIEFFIYDRWGEQIYHTNDVTSWGGIYKGKQVMDGVYIYKLLCKDVVGVEHEYTGHVSLIR